MISILSGIIIIDMSRLLPGPLGTQVLADLGADVLKIEEVNGGDYIRWIEPLGKQDSGNFLALNRNKRSMKLDLRQEAGKEILRKLVSQADVLVEQFRPGVLEKLGFSYDTLHELNPRLVICSISGFGQSGPDSQKAGHDINYLSRIGFLDLNGKMGGEPVIPATQIADIGGGSLWTALSILAALFDREKTGKGRVIDLSLTDAVFTFMSVLVGAYDMDGKLPERGADLLTGGYAWYYVYPTKDDRYLALGMLEMRFWEIFCKAIEKPEYIALHDGGEEVQAKLKEELGAMFLSKTAGEWMEMLDPLDVCISRVNTLAEALADAQLKARNMVVEIEHPIEGLRRSVALPLKFSGEDFSVHMPPPQFGEHTDAVLASLNYSPEEIQALHSAKVV